MGGTSFSRDDYSARTTSRASSAKGTFAYDYDIRTGAVDAKVHDSLSPKNLKTRESRDSAEHAVTVPIGITLDTTGSMQDVPKMIQKALPKLMGSFLDDKASGKKYLGDGYPAILISAVDDYDAQYRSYKGEGCLQVGQFESGIEIDDNLTNLWFTGNGGGTYSESYELALYVAARHTVHDHFEKRGRKGYWFIIGDEYAYPRVSKKQVADIIGASIQDDISLEDIIAEVQEKYHLFFVLPNMTSHYRDEKLYKTWEKLLGQQNVMRLDDPDKICELIVGAVALCEEFVGIDDLAADLGAGAYTKALVPLSKSASTGGAVSRFSATGLPTVSGASGGSKRL